ncbi:MAG TPA: hypothetical protein VFW76_07915 [Ktedonobacterales bacterium]|nr:hypothetical protein [Ktedonobacterales bacterium]
MKATSAPRPTLWLRLAQVGWVILAAVTLFLTLASVPPFFAALHHVLPTTDATDFGGQLTASASLSGLDALGLSLDFYARYTTALTLFIWLLFAIVGLVIFVRRANDRVALVAAYALILAPIAINTDILLALPAIWLPLILTLQFIGQISLMLLFYLFPSGRFAPDWTRWVFILGFIYWAVDIYAPVSVSNSILFFIAFLALELSLVIAQIARYRRVSTPRERQQTKWVVYGLALALGGTMLVIIVLYMILPQFFTPGAIHYMVGNAFEAALVVCIPLSFAVAILRSQLWDIDALINRTLVYGLLTAILAALYIGSVVLLGGLARGLSGQQDSAPVIVVSTLLIAALFQPLRHRLQSLIDRRFYRRKYDAAQTIAAFSATLRGNVDLSEMTDQLLATVDTTMRPSHVALWLSPRERVSEDNAPNGQ